MYLRIILCSFIFGMTSCSERAPSQEATNLAPSELTPVDHQHDWHLISLEGNPAILGDTAYAAVHEDEQSSYPKVLTRAYSSQSTESTHYADGIMAIDCVQSRLAPIDAFFSDEDGGEGERVTKTKIRFVPAKILHPTTRDAIFTHACGSEWSYDSTP